MNNNKIYTTPPKHETIKSNQFYNNQTPSSLFYKYQLSPKQTVYHITRPANQNKNPLYSPEAFDKYFLKTNGQQKNRQKNSNKIKIEMTKSMAMKTNQNRSVGEQKILRFHQKVKNLSQELAKDKMLKKMSIFQKFIDKSSEHFSELWIEQGKNPFPSFSRTNLHFQNYIEEFEKCQNLKDKKQQKQKVFRVNRAHTENIVDYLKKQIVECRYKNIPSFHEQKVEPRIESWKRTNKNLRERAKSALCFRNPLLSKKMIDQDLIEDSRSYMIKSGCHSALSRKKQ